MKTLKFQFDLNCRLAVYVPGTQNIDTPTDTTAYVNTTLRRLSELFGGATATPAYGGWITEAGNLVTEAVTVVYSFCTSEAAITHFPAVVELCLDLKRELSQEAITLEYNGQVKFI